MILEQSEFCKDFLFLSFGFLNVTIQAREPNTKVGGGGENDDDDDDDEEEEEEEL
jgi:hypothetical protein